MLKSKNEILCVLFDMDGTLTDTEPLGMKIIETTLADISIDLSDDELILFDKVWRRDGTDISTKEFVSNIFMKYGPKFSEEMFLKRFYKEYEIAISEAPELPGATTLLEVLDEKYSIALVTASTRNQAMTVLEKHGWGKYFDTVITQEEYKIKKPDPAGYIMAAEKLGTPISNCVVIEDSKNGVLSGKNAGMYVIGVKAGNEHQQDLTSADVVAENLIEVKKMLA